VYAVTTLHGEQVLQIAVVDLEGGGRKTVRIEGPPVEIGDEVVGTRERDGVCFFRLRTRM
jgi:hypothetical protein